MQLIVKLNRVESYVLLLICLCSGNEDTFNMLQGKVQLILFFGYILRIDGTLFLIPGLLSCILLLE